MYIFEAYAHSQGADKSDKALFKLNRLKVVVASVSWLAV